MNYEQFMAAAQAAGDFIIGAIEALGKKAVGAVVQGAEKLGGAVADATQAVKNTAQASFSIEKPSISAPSVKEAKALALEQEQHKEPTQMSASVDSALSKAGLKQERGQSEGMAMANASAFVGSMVSVGGIEDLGKPIAIATQTQSMGMAMG